MPPEHAYRERPVPILMLTSANPDEESPEYRQAGVNGFLYKPFQAEVVREALAKWIPLHV